MLSEEALIVLAALCACAVLVLGVIELLWPARPRHPLRHHPPAHNRAIGHPRHARVGRAMQTESGRVTRRRGTLRAAPLVAAARYIPAEPPAAGPQVPPAAAEAPTLASRRPAEPTVSVPRAVKPVAPAAKAVEPTARRGTPGVQPPVPVAPAAKEAERVARRGMPVIKPPVPVAPAAKEAEPIAQRGMPGVQPPVPVAPAAKEAERVAGRATPGVNPPVPVARVAPPVVSRPPAMPAVDECFALYQDRRYTEVVTLGMAALGEAQEEAAAKRPQETAALWSIVALARQAQGDDIGARGAIEAAIQAAPEADRVTYRHQLAALALHVAGDLLAAGAGRTATDSEERLNALRGAVAWIDAGLAATPDDPALRELRAPAFAALWPAYEQVVMALVQRQEFRAARRLLREAIDHGEFPGARTAAFRDLLSGTFSGEIGQLTAQAIRSMQEARESEALTALQRADELLGRLADEALPPGRREEVDRRLWWGYNKLGTRRADAGDFERALEPLFHALHFGSVGPGRQAETCAVLVRALAGVADTRALAIEQLAEAGDREAAVVQTDKLWALLRSATAQGVAEEQLSSARARVQRLFEGLGRKGEA